jgi:hypothetical protein
VYAGLIAAANERNDAFLAALDKDEQRVLASVFDKLTGAAREFIHAESAAGKGASKRPGSAARNTKVRAEAGASGKNTGGTKTKRSGS